jgi:two-component system chemotaxis response regulator CheY
MIPLATGWLEILVAPLWGAVVVIIVLIVAWLFRGPLTRLLSDLGISRLSVLGVDVEWVVGQTQAAYRERQQSPPGHGELHAFATLSAHLAPLVSHRRVLWVDDRPAGNAAETRLLRRLGIDVENATTTADALAQIAGSPARFDLVISDWNRGEGDDNGIALLTRLREDGFELPLVFYAGETTPERRAKAAELGAIGLTVEPDDLLKHVLVELATAA